MRAGTCFGCVDRVRTLPVHGQRAWRGVKPHEIEIMFVSKKEEHTVTLFVATNDIFFSQQINTSHQLQHSEHSG